MNAQKLWLLVALAVTGCDPAPVAELEPPTVLESAPIQTQVEQSPQLPANTIIGKVVSITDGDALDVLQDDMTTVRIRLASIDSPERGQPFGTASKTYLSELVFGKTVVVVTQGEDRYQRTIGSIVLPDQRIAEVELVRRGLAWHYLEYAPDDVVLYGPDDVVVADAELEARTAKRGLWSDPRHVAPWLWRQLSKAERDELR